MTDPTAITLEDVMREVDALPTFPMKYVDIKKKYIREMIIDLMFTAYGYIGNDDGVEEICNGIFT